VLSGIVGNPLEPDLEHMDYPAPQIETTDNDNQKHDNQKLGSHFSCNAESMGILMAIGGICYCAISNH